MFPVILQIQVDKQKRHLHWGVRRVIILLGHQFSGVSGTVTFNATAEEEEEVLEATTLEVFSGNNQNGVISTSLGSPFIARVLDQNGDNLANVTVNFSVTAGGGSLSASSDTTDSSGRAETTLTLGSSVGTNTVSASVSGISGSITFTATGNEELEATNLLKISGDNQTGTVSNALGNPFVVEVTDPRR